MLIFHGHATHTKNITLIEMERENHVHTLVIPPHRSHRLQPLDVSFMGPLNTYYEQAARVWLRNHPGSVVTIHQVATFFGTAYQRAATSSTTISGCHKTGIHQFNSNIFPDHVFSAAETTQNRVPGFGQTTSTSTTRRCSNSHGSTRHCPTSSFNTNMWLRVIYYAKLGVAGRNHGRSQGSAN